jgi:hypothetical protein
VGGIWGQVDKFGGSRARSAVFIQTTTISSGVYCVGYLAAPLAGQGRITQLD